MLESTAAFAGKNIVFGRAEYVRRAAAEAVVAYLKLRPTEVVGYEAPVRAR